nr:transglutaminase family protein [Pseudomonadales bacterium]
VRQISCRCDAPGAARRRDPGYGAPIFHAAWDGNRRPRPLTVRAAFATRDRPMARQALPRDTAEAERFLQPTVHMPVDGIVAETAGRIVKAATSTAPETRARAIYDWIVDNTFREPTVRGCGLGDIRFMLESGNLGGKCADINSLFVGLARAAGIPAREVYGVRVGPSAQFDCLGKPAGDVSGAQHCRAEFLSANHGWVPVDPADVRKAVLEEKLPLEHERIRALRERLFGYWEMNWVAFNHARDFELSPRARAPLPYLMYPYAEFGDTTLDGRDAAAFGFRIVSREIVA